VTVPDALIKVDHLGKVFRQGFWMRKVEAVRDVSFEVSAGHIYGFLGPNGAGKTTTIKMLTGLISPTTGSATVFGAPIGTAGAMRKVGFLPENPYVYPYLTPREFVEMCGRLSGLGLRGLRGRAERVLAQTGVLYAADRPVRRLSKGMLQRTGLAAALVADPELLILDEPMSGLDPVGRKEIRDLILKEREEGRTIFFSTHILSDVEMMCDHVTILRKGSVVVSGELSTLLRKDVKRTDVSVEGDTEGFERFCAEKGYRCRHAGSRLSVEVTGHDELAGVIQQALGAGLSLAEVVPRTESLEDLFLREAISEQAS
jgi:ABC-2 type transport system ATP-binding protein